MENDKTSILESDDRPWGRYEKIFEQNNVWVKRIIVNPNARLSLQKHKHRTERWSIVQGQGEVIINGQTIPVSPNSLIDVPLGAEHRIINTGEEILVFYEVAWGDELSEDDIIRLQDDYGREQSE